MASNEPNQVFRDKNHCATVVRFLKHCFSPFLLFPHYLVAAGEGGETSVITPAPGQQPGGNESVASLCLCWLRAAARLSAAANFL
jgi:hypothetical protein